MEQQFNQSLNLLLDNYSNSEIYSTSNDSFIGLDYGPLFPVPSRPSVDSEDNLSMSWWIKLIWFTIFITMILVAIGGNCIVIWIVIAHRRMRTVTNYFLVNLSTADLLLSTLNCLFNFIYMLNGDWKFGKWYCTVNNFIANVTVAASVFTLSGISCDRYLAIVRPLQPRMSKTCSLITIIFIWIASMLIAFPVLLYSSTITYKKRGKQRTACIIIWPDGQPTDSNMDFAYQIFFLIITYTIPVVLMIACYTGMGRVLWGSRSIGEMTQRQIDSIKSKRKVVKMFTFIVTVFVICWLPYHGYFIYTHYDRKILYTSYVQHIYLGFYWFAMSNAMVNPLIYYWMNKRFREYFQNAICCCRRALRSSLKNGDVTSPMVLRHNTYSYSKTGIIDESARSPLCLADHRCHDRTRSPQATIICSNERKLAKKRHLVGVKAFRKRSKKRRDSALEDTVCMTVNL